MTQVHLVMPYMRAQNKEVLLDAYRPMNVILHPIMFADEVIEFDEPWVSPCIIPLESKKGPEGMEIQNIKRNYFIEHSEIIDDDYYVAVDDDDMYEPNVFNEIKWMNDDIVIISMKRGHRTPTNVIPDRKYPTFTLWAAPENVQVGAISNQQSFVKGYVFKKYLYDAQGHCGDGRLAVRRKEAGEQIAYRPDLFALFNYYEPGRWDNGPKVVFGCMINDPLRFDQVLRRSQINSPLMFVQNPESATKGLNILLEKAENESADICCLVHQDMYFRYGWVEQMLSQIKLLPESWVVCGVIGKDASGIVCGKFHDMRIPDHFNTSDIHSFPHEACCFDEAVIIVNMKKGFRFDESLTGFDLYGTLCVLQAWEKNQTAWVIDAFCEHYCMRPFTWHPDQLFIDNYKMLHDRFSRKWKLDSTALGLSPDAEERLEQIRAFMTSAAPDGE